MEQRIKDDFSIEWDEDRFVSRREFFKFMTVASAGLVLGTAILAVWRSGRGTTKAVRTKVARVRDLPVGKSLQFSYPGKDDLCILVHRSDGEFAAFSRRCTHLSCPVQYQAEKARLFCPCHNGAFSLENGRPTQGPPRRALDRIDIEVEHGVVYATGVTRA